MTRLLASAIAAEADEPSGAGPGREPGGTVHRGAGMVFQAGQAAWSPAGTTSRAREGTGSTSSRLSSWQAGATAPSLDRKQHHEFVSRDRLRGTGPPRPC